MLRQFVSVPGHTVVFVSQDIEFVAASADRVILMDRGIIKRNSTLRTAIDNEIFFTSLRNRRLYRSRQEISYA